MLLYSKIEGSGNPLFILHGFLGMSDNWKTLAGQFSKSGFEVHTLDLRNHGRSFHSEVFNYQVMVQDVVNYCENYKLNDISIIGHSMGGKVAMKLATQFPDLVSKLIVADIGPKFYPQHHQSILAGINAVDFSQKPSRASIDEIVSNYIPDAGTRQFILKNLFWKTPENLAFRFNVEAFNNSIENIGEALNENEFFGKPTLFLRGSESHYILDKDFETIHYHFPLAKIQTVLKAGHWLHADNPTDFLEYSLHYLKS